MKKTVYLFCIWILCQHQTVSATSPDGSIPLDSAFVVNGDTVFPLNSQRQKNANLLFGKYIQLSHDYTGLKNINDSLVRQGGVKDDRGDNLQKQLFLCDSIRVINSTNSRGQIKDLNDKIFLLRVQKGFLYAVASALIYILAVK